jgi:hypothetical protein
MAARAEPKNGRPWTPERVRLKIKATLIAKRLQDHVLKGTEMTKSQVTAAGILLKKTIPDLQSVDTTLHGDPTAPLIITQTDGNL